MYTVAKKLFLLAYVNKLSFKNGWLALKDVLSTALCSQREEKGEDPGVWPTSTPSPASPPHSEWVEWDCSLHWPKCHWIAPVLVNRPGVITDLAGYAPRSGSSSTQVVSFKRYLLVIYVFILVNDLYLVCIYFTPYRTHQLISMTRCERD